MNNNLVKNKIYQGFYTFNREEYFSFFKIDDKDTAVDIITNQNFNLDKFTTIYYDVNLNYIKYIKHLYKNNKDLSLFLKKDSITVHLNTFFSKILRFFNLQEYTELSSTDIGKEKLDSVISKLKKYTRRYMDQPSIDIYAKHLEQFQSIKDILSVLPTELTEKVNPFWVKILQDGSLFTWSADYPIEAYELFNYFGFNVLTHVSENKKNVTNKYKKILEEYIPICESIHDDVLTTFKQKNKNLFTEKLKEAFSTLENENEIAKELNDEDLLKEIDILKNELKDIEDKIEKLIADDSFINLNIYDWFPELLYPVPDDYTIEEIKFIYFSLTDVISYIKNNDIYPYYDNKLKIYLLSTKEFNEDLHKKVFNIFKLKNFF